MIPNLCKQCKVAFLFLLFVGFCMGSLSGKSCPTTTQGECDGHGECTGSSCSCNIGFGGLDCSDSMYRKHHQANFDTDSSVTLVPFLIGTSSGESITIELDALLKVTEFSSSSSRLFHVSQGGTSDIFELSISNEGKLVLLSTCGSSFTAGVASEFSIPLNTWLYINMKINGTHQASGCPSNGQAIVMVGNEEYIHQQVHLPVSMLRETAFVGEFSGSMDYIKLMEYPVGTPFEGACLENEGDYELFDCDFTNFDSNVCGLLDSSQLQLSTNSILDRFRYGMYIWTHGIQILNNEVGWFFQLYDEVERTNLISVARQRGIDFLLVNNVCPTSDCPCVTLEWKYNHTSNLLFQAHQHGIQVYALYTEKYFIEDIANYVEEATANSWETYDGIALNYENFNYTLNPEKYFDQVQSAKSVAAIFGIPLHVSVSFAWTVNATWKGVMKPFQDHLLSILTPGDSLDIQVAWPGHCIYEARASTYIKAATEKNISSWVTLETKMAFSSIGWYQQGEVVLWEDIRDSFGNSLPPTGFIFHHYKDSLNSGMPGWDLVGLPYCPTYTDSCGICGGTGMECNWTSLWMSMCGDGLCQPELGETCTTCTQDCAQTDLFCFEIQLPTVCMTKSARKEKKPSSLSIDVMMIIGAIIGGLVCIIIMFILGLVIHKKIKRKLHKPKAPPPIKPLIKTKNIVKLEQESNERARRMTMTSASPPDLSQLANSSSQTLDKPPNLNRPRSATIASIEFRPITRTDTPPWSPVPLQSASPPISRKGGLTGQRVPNDTEGSPIRPRKLPPLNSSQDDFPSRPSVNSLVKDDKKGHSLSKSGERLVQSGETKNRSPLVSHFGETDNRISRSEEIEMSQMISGTELRIGERQRRPTISISVDFSQPIVPIKESKDLF